jgi:hypothetical protein
LISQASLPTLCYPLVIVPKQANAPAIAAAASGAAAAKLAYDRRDNVAKGGRSLLRNANGEGRGQQQVARMVVEREQLPPVVFSSHAEDE